MLRNKHGGPLIGLRLFSVALRYLLPFPTCRNLLQLDLTEISQGGGFQRQGRYFNSPANATVERAFAF